MILKATQIPPVKFPKRPQSRAAKYGLSFQRKFTQALKATAPSGISVQPNLWFNYVDQTGSSLICSPDIVLVDREEGFAAVVEVKTTYTPLALQKLRELYCPVVSKALSLPTRPIVAVKNLVPGCPPPRLTITSTIATQGEPLFQWIGRGPVQW